MRKLLASIILGASLAFSGCSGSYSIRDSAKLETPVQKAQAAIDQTNATITATARVVLSNYQTGVITKEEARGYQQKLIEAVNYANQAQAALTLGEATSAGDYTKLAQNLITWLEAELVKVKNRGN